MKKLGLISFAVSALLLTACGGGGSGSSSNKGQNSNTLASDPSKIYNVEYTLNGSNHPTCHNAAHITGLQSSSTDMTCQWICGSYEGASPIHVLLSFKKIGDAWEFDRDLVMTSPANYCHN